jgi:hypothetical protein
VIGVAAVAASPEQSSHTSASTNAAAKSAITTGVAFEQMLVQELSQELQNTVSSGGADDGSGGDGSSDASTSTGLFGSDAAGSAYGDMIPTALTDGVMSGGGLGIAQQIAQSIDPALRSKA